MTCLGAKIISTKITWCWKLRGCVKKNTANAPCIVLSAQRVRHAFWREVAQQRKHRGPRLVAALCGLVAYFDRGFFILTERWMMMCALQRVSWWRSYSLEIINNYLRRYHKKKKSRWIRLQLKALNTSQVTVLWRWVTPMRGCRNGNSARLSFMSLITAAIRPLTLS